jgi:hypothetical protein
MGADMERAMPTNLSDSNSHPAVLREGARLLLQRMQDTPGAEERRKLATRAFGYTQKAEVLAELLRRGEGNAAASKSPSSSS